MPVPVQEDAMEVNALCEETVGPPDMEAFFHAAGEFYDHYTGEILDRDATIAGIRAELTQMQEFGVFEWKRKYEKPLNEKVISTKMFHKAKGDEVQSRIVGVFAPEHHTGTPPTWALKLVIRRMMSKGRTRQLASHDVSVAFFHAWLERGVWVKPPKDLRLNDDLVWCGESSQRNERIKQSIPRSGTRDVDHMRVDPAADCTMPCLLR